MTIEDTFLVECGREHLYAMAVGEDPTEYPCPFCGAEVKELEE